MKEKNGEYLNIGEATEDCWDVNELTYALKGSDGDEHMGFVINDDTNTNDETNNATTHPLCRWSYFRTIMNTTGTHLARKTHAMDIITYLKKTNVLFLLHLHRALNKVT